MHLLVLGRTSALRPMKAELFLILFSNARAIGVFCQWGCRDTMRVPVQSESCMCRVVQAKSRHSCDWQFSPITLGVSLQFLLSYCIWYLRSRDLGNYLPQNQILLLPFRDLHLFEDCWTVFTLWRHSVYHFVGWITKCTISLFVQLFCQCTDLHSALDSHRSIDL